MYCLVKNGGAIFYTSNEKQIAWLYEKYDVEFCCNVDGFVPKVLIPYLGKFYDKENYSFYFSYLKKLGLSYDLNLAIIKPGAGLENGLYRLSYTNNVGLCGLPLKVNNMEMAEILPLPIHCELFQFLENTTKELEDLKKENTELKDLLTSLKTDLDNIKIATQLIATSIQTIPTAHGSPVNPGLVITLTANVDPKITQINTTIDNNNNNIDNYTILYNKLQQKVSEK